MACSPARSFNAKQSLEAVRFGPDGNLYVNSQGTDQVLRYNGATGAFIDVFASGGGLDRPIDLTFGPDGNLYVGNPGVIPSGNVLRYDGDTGAFIDVFATVPGFGPGGLLFVPEPASALLALSGVLVLLVASRWRPCHQALRGGRLVRAP
ncbi:MAG: hypothetical protein DWQ37_06550 [Planctomycetota bacterium]|nr:MAG: hypothetical protein DWQ37_06550 [Planctomycetota bacterium]